MTIVFIYSQQDLDALDLDGHLDALDSDGLIHLEPEVRYILCDFNLVPKGKIIHTGNIYRLRRLMPGISAYEEVQISDEELKIIFKDKI